MQNYKIVAVNYADRAYRKTQKLNTKTAYKTGKVDAVVACSRQDIPKDFQIKNKDIFKSKTGGGYWLWKPYVVLKAYKTMNDGDYLIYADAGGFYYKGDVHIVTDIMEARNQWLLVQDQPFLEKHYTKRDTFLIMNCDTPFYTDGFQCMGGLFIIKKCDVGNQFLNEWLAYCQNYAAISNAGNICGKPDYEGFVAHRNDQSIFSILRRRYGIKSFDSITQGGKYEIMYYHRTRYGHIWQIKIYQWYKKHIYLPIIIEMAHKLKPLKRIVLDSFIWKGNKVD